jgi:hypothetical protein
MAWHLFRLWMQMVSRYSMAVNILNKKLWAAKKKKTLVLQPGGRASG